MCGIAGICCFESDIPQKLVDAVRRMTRNMGTRGPDAEGLWKSDNVALGHRRLAILDLDSRADQPMRSSDDRFCIAFNGEIYNFRELRLDLEAKGETFRTASDTEVLLSLYARYGPDMLPKLRGMFAFAIWDSQAHQLFLARDPYGIKPLYYAATKCGLVFASQVKAILASGLLEREIETAGIAGFYLWGDIPEPWTPYRGLFSLPPEAGCVSNTACPKYPSAGTRLAPHGDKKSVPALQTTCKNISVMQSPTPSARTSCPMCLSARFCRAG